MMMMTTRKKKKKKSKLRFEGGECVRMLPSDRLLRRRRASELLSGFTLRCPASTRYNNIYFILYGNIYFTGC